MPTAMETPYSAQYSKLDDSESDAASKAEEALLSSPHSLRHGHGLRRWIFFHFVLILLNASVVIYLFRAATGESTSCAVRADQDCGWLSKSLSFFARKLNRR
jgi:hypothetical protein